MGIASNLMRLGSDQLQTQYDIVFPKGIPGGGNTDLLSFRADTTFDPPERTVGSYTVFKKGVKIPYTNMVQDMDKEGLTIEFRLDQEWAVYDALNAWHKLCYDYETGTALPELACRTDFYVQAKDKMDNTVKTLKFIDAKIKGLKINTFDNQGSDPVRVQATFIFNDMDME